MEIVKATNIVLQQMLGGQSLTSSSAVSGFSLLYTLLLLLTSMGDSPARDQLMQTLDIGPAAVDEMLPTLNRLEPMQSLAATFLRPRAGSLEASIADLQQSKLKSQAYPLYSVDDVNNWCSAATEGRIPTILDHLADEEVMVLASAIHFKANWSDPFPSAMTTPQLWTDLTGSERKVDTMHLYDAYQPVWRDPVSSGVVLSYRDAPSISAVISLPTLPGEKGLDVAIQQMAHGRPELGANPRDVTVELPKFLVETTTDCLPVLAGLGLDALFQPFPVTAIEGAPLLGVSQAIQKVFLDVTEAGTEAAAVSAIAMFESAPAEPPVVVSFNRPFVFALVDNETGLRLFSAVISNL